jgi:hypothetical protein
MDHDLEVPVNYKNQKLIFIATFIQFGYSYKFEVNVNGTVVFFEPDEERNFRAIIDPNDNGNRNIDRELIELILESLIQVMK